MKTSYRIASIVVLVAFVLSFSIVPHYEENVYSNTESLCMVDSWPMFQKDLSNSGSASENALPFTDDPEILWKYELDRDKEGRILTNTPIVYNGKVYTAGYNDMAHKTYETRLLCFDAENGDKLWSFELDPPIERQFFSDNPKTSESEGSGFFIAGVDSTPVIGDNKLFVTTVNGHIYCFDVYNDDLLWDLPISHTGRCEHGKINDDNVSPSTRCHSSGLYVDGYLYLPIIHLYWIKCKSSCNEISDLPFGDIRVYKIDANLGKVEDSFSTDIAIIDRADPCTLKLEPDEYSMRSSIAYYEGMIFHTSIQRLYCLKYDSLEKKWDTVVTNKYPCYSSPTVSSRVYYGNLDNQLFCYSINTGRIKWNTTYKQAIRCTTCPLVIEQKLYFHTRDEKLVCYDESDKEILWTIDTDKLMVCPAVNCNNDVLCQTGSNLTLLEGDSGDEIWKIEIDDISRSSPAVCNGRIYNNTLSGSLYCIGEKPESIKIESCNESIDVGQEFVLEANGYNGRNRTRVHYSLKAEPEGIVSITGNRVTGLKEGTVEITARCGLVEDTCTVVVVKPQKVTSIEIDPVSKIVSLGESYTFSATVYDQDREAMEANVVWSVSDESIASVDSEGTVTGIKAGKTDVIASVGDIYETARLIVNDDLKVERIELSPDDATLDVGETVQFEVKAYNWNDEMVECSNILWSVEPTDAGEISSDGLFTAGKSGLCIVTASCNGVEASVNVVVNRPLEPANISTQHQHLDFGVIQEGETRTKELELTNTGDIEGVVFIESSHDWLSVSENSFTISPSETKSIDIAINTNLAGDFEELSGELTISYGDGEHITISVSAVIKPSCSISIMPESLFFGMIHRGKEMTLPFVISSQSKNIKGSIEVSDPWITVTQTNFDLSDGEVEGSLSIKASALPAGESFEGKLLLIPDDSSCKSVSVSVAVRTDKDIDLQLTIGQSDATLNELKIELDVPPQIIDGRTLVPVRFISESFGCSVGWEADTGKITITRGDFTIILYKDQSIALINGKEYRLDVPATIVSGRTLVPVRFISEGFGASVNWIAETRTIEISWEPF